MKIDFHVHTNTSYDSIIKPEDLIKKSKATGVIPVITDHDSIEGWKKMERGSFIPGIEIRTKEGDLIGIFINESIPRKIAIEEAIDRIKEQGGLVYLPHMYDSTRSGCGAAYANLADIIEVFNARCDERCNRMADDTAKKLNKVRAAGSDSHFLFEFGNTYVETEDFDIESPKEMIKALKSKSAKIIGKCAPFYVRGPTWALSKARKLWRWLKK
ncbi:MAG: PHP domain-containing protein [Candidatus Bilamarchaeaceae archaeon]